METTEDKGEVKARTPKTVEEKIKTPHPFSRNNLLDQDNPNYRVFLQELTKTTPLDMKVVARCLTDVTELDCGVPTDSAWARLAQCIETYPEFHVIKLHFIGLAGPRLRGNMIGSPNMQALTTALRLCTKLHTLDIGNCRINDAQAQGTTRFVLTCPTLRRFSIAHNHLTSAAMQSLLNALSKCPLLTHLNIGYQYGIDNNTVNVNSAEALARTLATVLLNCSLLEELAVGSLAIGDAGIAILSTQVSACPNLRKLDIGNNNINAKSAGKLVIFLLNCPQLSSLDMRYNDLGSSGIFALAPILPRLKVLNLSGNAIGDTGAKILAYNLTLPDMALRKLYVTSNLITKEGARALGEALPQVKLRILNISNNFFTRDGYQHILDGLLLNGSITRLEGYAFDLQNNGDRNHKLLQGLENCLNRAKELRPITRILSSELLNEILLEPDFLPKDLLGIVKQYLEQDIDSAWLANLLVNVLTSLTTTTKGVAWNPSHKLNYYQLTLANEKQAETAAALLKDILAEYGMQDISFVRAQHILVINITAKQLCKLYTALSPTLGKGDEKLRSPGALSVFSLPHIPDKPSPKPESGSD